jgi:hypothetical protein
MPDVGLTAPFSAYGGSAPYVFVSYAHADGAKVFPEITFLHEHGYRIWYDEGIDPGNEWPDEIARALHAASYFLVFVSPRSVASSNVRNEINVALNKRKPFLAIHLEETELTPGLELRMGDIQALMRFRMGVDAYREKLLKVLPASLKGEALPQSPAATGLTGQAPIVNEAASAPSNATTHVADNSARDPNAYARLLGLSVVDSAGASTKLSEYGIVYRPFASNTLSEAFREGLILEKGAATQTIPWGSIRRVVMQDKDSATVELRDGRSMGPVKPRSGYMVGTDEFGFDFGLSLADAATITLMVETGVAEWEALLRDIPELARKTMQPAVQQVSFRFLPQEHGVLVTLDTATDGKPVGSQTFELPGPYRFTLERGFVGSLVAVHAKEYWNLGPYDEKKAASLAELLTRLNDLASTR